MTFKLKRATIGRTANERANKDHLTRKWLWLPKCNWLWPCK